MLRLNLQLFGGRGAGSGMSASGFDRASFTNEGNGQWTLDTPMGGASILDESDDFRYGGTAYSVKAWDSNYNMIGETEIYTTLNAAKSAAKDKIRNNNSGLSQASKNTMRNIEQRRRQRQKRNETNRRAVRRGMGL